ncbi:MAG: hypothetical protein IPM80_00035 [Proteobacteria bacterium]|nr:hypothetical protein [Pseudomonadota bacterium]
MYASSLLESWLEDNCTWMHKARQGAVCKLVDGLLRGGVATLTAMGRHIPMQQAEKHGIKCADRLLGNRHLSAERLKIYQALGRWLLADIAQPWVVVDWSDVRPGRCYGSPATHLAFLGRLKSVVPSSCRPILITDAGFRGPWFKAVSALGWGLDRPSSRPGNVSPRVERTMPPRQIVVCPGSDRAAHSGLGVAGKNEQLSLPVASLPRHTAKRAVAANSTPSPTVHASAARSRALGVGDVASSERLVGSTSHAPYRQRMQIEETFR